ncbi:hypothetical protein ROA7023_00357 [Roseisalinus antarcticus]|uniref:Uncharacterized protein n=1 Tax=Roseisalinus antarcticus TaxID=254357 RepID=A0A1Y5RJI5_9RHOB|nr:hypothetical protein ROA7023_00357 [Roseisalinus antarcticus]
MNDSSLTAPGVEQNAPNARFDRGNRLVAL